MAPVNDLRMRISCVNVSRDLVNFTTWQIRPSHWREKLPLARLPAILCTFLNTLKAPRLSELTRKRRIDTNPPPPKGKRRARGEGSSEPKTVTATQRVKEFTGECLTATSKGAAKLFCNACREELSQKKTL